MYFSRDFTVPECWGDNGEGCKLHSAMQLSELEFGDWVKLSVKTLPLHSEKPNNNVETACSFLFI